MGRRDRNARLRRIGELDPEKDYREITALFYLDFQAIMVLQAVTGNLMTFAVPRMSRILTATKQFENHTTKRFVDTTLLVQAVLDHGLGPGDGRDAARRVNAMHRQYDIHPEDFVAVGCDVPVMSLDIADRFGWRPVTDAEREALRIHYSAEARAFGSGALPPTLPEMRAVWDSYLDENTAFEPQNRSLAEAFLGFLPELFPRPLRPLVRPLLLPQVDPRILRACGLREPSARAKRISTMLMRALGRTGPGPDPKPGELNPIEKLAESVYPHGWTVHTLGTHSAGTATHEVAGDDRREGGVELAVDQDEDDSRRDVAPVGPGVVGAALHDDVARGEGDLGVVEDQGDLALEHDAVVDRRGAVDG